MSNKSDFPGTEVYPSSMKQNTYINDVNKVFIPFRPVLEMELMLSAVLAFDNYEHISKFSFNSLDANVVTKELELENNHLFHSILERFFQSMQNIIPVAMIGRNTGNEVRYGNVNAYTESRIPLFYAIDRLKVKIVIMKNFFSHFKENHYQLNSFKSFARKADKSVTSILFTEYYERMVDYFTTIVYAPKYQEQHLNSSEIVNYKSLYKLNSHRMEAQNSEVNYIVRGLKSSLLTTKIMFDALDVPDPYTTNTDAVESLLLNRDFIPGMINVISVAYHLTDAVKLREMVDLFLCYLDNVLNGINNGVTIASNNQMFLELDETIYFTGDILKF